MSNTLELLAAENHKLKAEVERLEFSNAILSRLFYYAAKKLGKYTIPMKPEVQDGEINFRKIGDLVEIIFSDLPEKSATGDPILDGIFRQKSRKFY